MHLQFVLLGFVSYLHVVPVFTPIQTLLCSKFMTKWKGDIKKKLKIILICMHNGKPAVPFSLTTVSL